MYYSTSQQQATTSKSHETVRQALAPVTNNYSGLAKNCPLTKLVQFAAQPNSISMAINESQNQQNSSQRATENQNFIIPIAQWVAGNEQILKLKNESHSTNIFATKLLTWFFTMDELTDVNKNVLGRVARVNFGPQKTCLDSNKIAHIR